MSDKSFSKQGLKPLVDEYGNQHYLAEEIARGGQGVVYRTKDADLAIKQPLSAGHPDKNVNLRDCFQNIRLLPIPSHIPVSLPLSILRDEPGYVMRLLSGMKSFRAFELGLETKKNMDERESDLPQWLRAIPDRVMASQLAHYANTGSTRRRLSALSKCASILSRLHHAGLVYGDISPNNVFIGNEEPLEVWLIDADNLRFELHDGGSAMYTPGYGAPEVVRGMDCSRPRSDCWSFAVMAFKILSQCHPFIGKKVLDPEVDICGWSDESVIEGLPTDLYEQAYTGYLPFIDDKDDASNQGVGGLTRVLVTTPKLRILFQKTFGEGKGDPHRRPAMAIWALELTKASDISIDCQQCNMSYFADEFEKCPYCSAHRTAFLRAKTHRWEILIPCKKTEFSLPHRLFFPFSFELNDDTEYEVVLDFAAKTVTPVRGTKSLPNDIVFEFQEAVK